MLETLIENIVILEKELGVTVDFKESYKVHKSATATYLCEEDAKKIHIDHEVIVINSQYLKYATEKEVFGTIAHELRHAYQNKMARTPITEFGRKCAESFANYVRPKDDFVAYSMQFVELDAIAYQEVMLNRFYKCNLFLPPVLREAVQKHKKDYNLI